MLTFVSEVVHKPFIYNEFLHFSKSAKWQNVMQEKYNAFVKNHM